MITTRNIHDILEVDEISQDIEDIFLNTNRQMVKKLNSIGFSFLGNIKTPACQYSMPTNIDFSHTNYYLGTKVVIPYLKKISKYFSSSDFKIIFRVVPSNELYILRIFCDVAYKEQSTKVFFNDYQMFFLDIGFNTESKDAVGFTLLVGSNYLNYINSQLDWKSGVSKVDMFQFFAERFLEGINILVRAIHLTDMVSKKFK